MGRRNKPGRRAAASSVAADAALSRGKLPSANRWQGILIAAFVTLLVARTLVPEDPGGQQGFGAPFDVLTLVLAGAWLLGEFRSGALRLQFDWPDALLLALIGWHTISALAAVSNGAPRPAMNMLWEWLALGMIFVLARQIIRTSTDARQVIVVLLGLACGESAIAVHQYWITIPRDIVSYDVAKNSTESLYQLTSQWMEPGSSIRQQFEARLNSRLPGGTFALSNTLAGFLVPWFVVLVAVVARQRRALLFAVGVIVALLIVLCLWLTGSRAAAIAVIVGIVLLVIQNARAAGIVRRWWLVTVAAVFIAAGGALVAPTSLGTTAIDAAIRSLSFRVEYWQATLAMIADCPILGCGPGQFQDTYTAYKLPGAAEEVQDPHNWLLEVWATAGTPAAILLLATLGVIIARSIRGSEIEGGAHGSVEPGTDRSQHDSDGAPLDAAVFGGVAGIVLGIALAWLTGFPLARPHVVILVAFVIGAWFIGKNWALNGPLPRNVCLIAAVALLVNLLAAGGIGYPNVANSLWLLLAIQLNASSRQHVARVAAFGTRTATASIVRWTVGIVLVTLLAIAIWIEYSPVMACRMQLAIADSALAGGRPDLSRAACEAAAAADPWSVSAASRLAAQQFADYEVLTTPTRLRNYWDADLRKLALAPRRSGNWAQSAEHAAAIYRNNQSAEYVAAARQYFERAIALYPTSARFHAQAAQFWNSIGEYDRARDDAAKALRYDDAMHAAGHSDRWLDQSLRNELESFVQDSR